MPPSTAEKPRPHCATPPPPPPALAEGMPMDRQRAIIRGRSKWVNGTVLHYAFFGRTPVAAWNGPEAQRNVVRSCFKEWKDIGIGLEFQEVDDRREAEVKIGFDQSDGSWSQVGRDVLGTGANERTMNFGWDLTTDYGRTTALHEIGHTLGLPHEHQNPFAGIVWNEQAVYDYFAGPPNGWPRDQTFHNVLRKLSPSDVDGSQWDPDSIMEYWFPAGLIVQPAKYQNGLDPPGTLSAVDKDWAKRWYPGKPPAPKKLVPFQSVPLELKPAEQVDFTIQPPSSRRYTLQTFGTADTVLVLFEEVHGQLRYVAGDDDSGTDANAAITARLFRGRKYVLRLRLYWEGGSGTTGVMYS